MLTRFLPPLRYSGELRSASPGLVVMYVVYIVVHIYQKPFPSPSEAILTRWQRGVAATGALHTGPTDCAGGSARGRWRQPNDARGQYHLIPEVPPALSGPLPRR
jgi:hypothetical protein